MMLTASIEWSQQIELSLNFRLGFGSCLFSLELGHFISGLIDVLLVHIHTQTETEIETETETE